MKKAWLRIKELLRTGITPEKLALSAALGVVLARFPVIGATMLMCAGVAVMLRLNLPAMQVANLATYPLQLLMLLPLIRIGETIFRAPPLALTAAQLTAMLQAGVWYTTKQLWRSGLHAITAWTLIAPLAVLLIYVILAPVL